MPSRSIAPVRPGDKEPFAQRIVLADIGSFERQELVDTDSAGYSRRGMAAAHRHRSFRMAGYARTNGRKWPAAAVPHVRRKRVLKNQALAAKDSLWSWLRTHAAGHDLPVGLAKWVPASDWLLPFKFGGSMTAAADTGH
jgi:hypothetical protein